MIPDSSGDTPDKQPEKKKKKRTKTNDELAAALGEPDLQKLRDAFDVLFGKYDMTPAYKKTLDRFHLTSLLLTDEELRVDSEEKAKWLSQYRNSLCHLSFGVYATLKPAKVVIDIPQKSGQYKFILVEPGIR